MSSAHLQDNCPNLPGRVGETLTELKHCNLHNSSSLASSVACFFWLNLQHGSGRIDCVSPKFLLRFFPLFFASRFASPPPVIYLLWAFLIWAWVPHHCSQRRRQPEWNPSQPQDLWTLDSEPEKEDRKYLGWVVSQTCWMLRALWGFFKGLVWHLWEARFEAGTGGRLDCLSTLLRRKKRQFVCRSANERWEGDMREHFCWTCRVHLIWGFKLDWLQILLKYLLLFS